MSDDISKRIDELIVETPDAKDKALLLILKKISDNLEDNTALTRTLTQDLKAHTDAFEKHEKDEMALISQGRGFLKAAVFGLAFFQAIFAWYAARHIKDMDGLSHQVKENSEEIAVHKEHHRQEEKYRGGAKVDQ